MSFTVTQPMSVTKVITTSIYSNKLTFLVKPVSPLFVNSIVITRSADGQFSSDINAGADAAHPGKVQIYLNDSSFTSLHAQAVLPFKVILTYDDLTLDVIQLELVRELAAVSDDLVASLVIALQQVLPNLPNGPAPALLAERENGRVNPPD